MILAQKGENTATNIDGTTITKTEKRNIQLFLSQ
jgi:hypothetical protein